MSEKLIGEQQLGDIPWLVVRGNRRTAFTALGAHSAQQIREIIDGVPEVARLRALTKTPSAARHLEDVCRASRTDHPNGWLELSSLAIGAGVEISDLLLLNLRGDMGADDHGCSDLGWTDGTRALLGHNEDGDPVLNGRCRLLTLMLENEVPVTTWWYPGFLPGNTFSVNADGLVWGLDALQVIDPPAAPGRCFVARSVQKATSVDGALSYLREHPTAGGFAYNFGKVGDAQLTTVETGAGHYACSADKTNPRVLWHTNHARILPHAVTSASEDSLARARFLSQIMAPEVPRADWIARHLGYTPLPNGVRATGTDSVTLCTLVADLESSDVVLLPHDGRAVTLPLHNLARGDASGAAILPADLQRQSAGGSADRVASS